MAEGNSLFELGFVLGTPGALRLMLLNGVAPQVLLRRHVTGDWSEMVVEDQAANRLAATQGLRILSAFRITSTQFVWLITEADRSATTFLKPSEY